MDPCCLPSFLSVSLFLCLSAKLFCFDISACLSSHLYLCCHHLSFICLACVYLSVCQSKGPSFPLLKPDRYKFGWFGSLADLCGKHNGVSDLAGRLSALIEYWPPSQRNSHTLPQYMPLLAARITSSSLLLSFCAIGEKP